MSRLAGYTFAVNEFNILELNFLTKLILLVTADRLFAQYGSQGTYAN